MKEGSKRAVAEQREKDWKEVKQETWDRKAWTTKWKPNEQIIFVANIL